MFLYFKLFISSVFFVILAKFSKSTLSISSKPSKIIFKLCDHGNSSCLNNILEQKFIIFNSEINQNITAKLGNIEKMWTMNKDIKYFSRIHTERRAYLVPSNSNEININSICEVTYEDKYLPYIDDSFCCRIELALNDKVLPNPYSSCELRILPKPAYCFIPIKVKTSSFFHNKVFSLIGKIYQKQFGSCNYQLSKDMIYSISPPLKISFTKNLPVIWKLSSFDSLKILLGVPLYSVNIGETLLVPVRMISDRAGLDNQIICIQCHLDQNLFFNSIIVNYPNVSIINNVTFSDDSGFFLNVKLKITPGLNQQLMFLNVTVNLDSRQSDTINNAKLHCCNCSVNNVNQKEYLCEDVKSVEIPLKQSYSITIIPAVNDSKDSFAIYSMPYIIFPSNLIKVYGITNYKDRTVNDLTSGVSVFPVDSTFLTMPNNINKNPMEIEMNYQTFLNSWSIQLEFHNTIHTFISPFRVWRPKSWKIVLSDNVLQPIKNWAIPESSSQNAICVSRYKVARLKIYCRMYVVEETGESRYIGKEESDPSDIPFIDVTSMTKLSQLKITTEDIIFIQKPLHQDHFLVYAKQVGRSSDIQLVSRESQRILATTKVSVVTNDLFVLDLIIHCIDALSLYQQNKSINDINKPNEHQTITVTLNSNSPSKPCYLVVFVVYSDKSVEHISSVNNNQYRLIFTKMEFGTIVGTSVNDSQLVTVQHLPHTNISLYEPSSCRDSKLILTKQIEWVTKESIENMVPLTTSSSWSLTTIPMNDSHQTLFNKLQNALINPVHISIYVCTGVVGVCFVTFVFYKLFCYRNRSHGHGATSSIYQRSGLGTGFIDDSNMKIPIRSSNHKHVSGLGKCSSNCLCQNNRTHTNEPYPPLLPPPGPIAANYDLTIMDPVCNDSAVDSGVEIGKLSSYSSNTCPSNDLCCTIDLYPSCSLTEDSLIRQYPTSQFSNSMIGFYTPKEGHESETQFRDSNMLPILNSTKTISNLRHPYW